MRGAGNRPGVARWDRQFESAFLQRESFANLTFGSASIADASDSGIPRGESRGAALDSIAVTAAAASWFS
jgi:hypothetical protein